MEKNLTRGVRILLGDPKKAVIKLSLPMMVGMLVQTLYNLVDGIWVAGLGKDALAAIGLFFPVYMIIVSLASGLSVGGSSAISRKIGAKDKKMADCAAIHSLAMTIILGILITITTLPFLPRIFSMLGAKGQVLEYVTGYSRIIIGSTLIIFFSNIAGGILRGEGDTRRTMYVMIFGSVINIFLDPLFIYVFKMGINGAAWATVLSITVSSVFLFKWLFVNKSTYVSFEFKHARYNTSVVNEILKVGLPASFSQLSMALAVFVINIIIIKVGGTDGVAVFTSSWRIMMFGIVPLLGIAIGVTAVTGTAYGARDLEKLKTAYFYGVKIGGVIELLIAAMVYIFAVQLAFLFTYSKGSASLSPDMILALRILVLFLPGVPLGMITSSMFQGIGKGMYSFWVTFLRTIIFQIIFTYLFGIVFSMGMKGIWLGITLGNITASLVAFIWGQFVIKRIKYQLASFDLAMEV